MRKFISILTLSLCHLLSFGADEKLDVTNTGLNLTNDLSLQNTVYSEIVAAPSTWFNALGVKNIKNQITFGIDQSMYQVDLDYDYKVVFDIETEKLSGNVVVPGTYPGIELTLNYNPLGAYQDKEVFTFENCVSAKIVNIQLFKWNGTSYAPTTVDRENLFLRNAIQTEYYHNFNYAASPTSTVSLTPSGSDLIVNWPFLQGAEAYDLEWTWVNGYDGTVSGSAPNVSPESAVSYDFKHNASRVRVSDNQFRIPMIYGDGYVLVRYRGIGRVVDHLDIPIEGKWMTDGTVYTDNNLVSAYPSSCRTSISAFEGNGMNYGAAVIFTEEGKHNVGVSYMDGMLKPRQSQTQLSSQDEIIVGSMIYDYYGRPAIGVMGSPVNQDDLGYVQQLNMLNSATPYDKEVFHKDAFLLGICGPDAAPPMDPITSKGSAKYYSTQNLNKEGTEAYIPDANGYNFVQVHYANDQTGRVRRMGGVGEDHQLDPAGHYTEVINDIPGTNEVDELLGSEAADHKNYTKVITKDVHGQVSIAIIDNYGRTVISYLEGSAPTGLDYIEGNGPLTAINVDLAALTSTETALLDQGILLVDKKIAVTDPNQIFTFNYDFEALSYTDCLPPGICFDCLYEIEFTITPAEGGFSNDCPLKKDGAITSTYTWTHSVGNITSFDTNCDNPILFSDDNPSTFILQFPRFGEYYVKKELKVLQAPIEYYWDEFVNNADPNCLIPYSNFLADAMLDIDYSQCYDGTPCMMNFLFEYGTWDVYALETGETDEGVYNTLQDNFILECENQPFCEQMLPMLLADLQPGGQYGDVSGTDPLSIFNTSGSLAQHWQSAGVVFYEIDGVTPAMTTNNSGAIVPVNDPSISLSEFLLEWDSHWAESILEAHPEHQTYLFCSLYPSVFTYETDFKLTDTWADAAVAGYITPVDPSLHPGCFAGSPTSFTSGDPLINLIDGALGSLISTPSYIYDDPYLPGINHYDDAAQYMLNSCGGATLYEMASEISDGSVFGTSTCDLDAQWRSFRDLYLTRRNLILQVAMEGRAMTVSAGYCTRCIAYSSNFCSTNGCGDYAAKVKRFPLFDQMMPLPFIELINNPTSLLGTATTNTTDFCEGACESMADGWMIELAGCASPMGITWVAGDPEYEALKDDLVEVCKGGCSPEWPFPSQYSTSGAPYASFEEVIITYIGGSETLDCNHFLIDKPTPVPNQSLIPRLSSCGCDQLLSVDNDVDFEAYFGFLPVNFCADRQACADEGALNIAIIYSEGSIGWTTSQINQLETIATLTQYPCSNTCIECEHLEVATNNFLDQFPNASVVDNPVMFTSFVNQMYETSFDYYSLTEFQAICDSINNNGAVSSGLTMEALDLLDLLNAMIPDNLLTNSSYGATTTPPYNMLPEYFGSIFYNCTSIEPYDYQPSFSANSGQLKFSLNHSDVNGDGVTCNHCPDDYDWVYLTPESTGGWSNATDLYNNITSFTSIYVTSIDLNSGPPPGWVSFHMTASVLNPSTGINEDVIFFGRTQCFSVFEGNNLCSNMTPEYTDDCIDALIASAEMEASSEYGIYLAAQKQDFIKDYIETCRGVNETYDYNYLANKYHYTLLYYDRAGNLAKTVSPKGIATLSPLEVAAVQLFRATDGTSGAEHYPGHTFETEYYFNALNQPIETTTPDGGSTKFWHDHLGRMVVSQNARQADLTSNVINGNPFAAGYSLPAYSYNLYDNLGRPIEVGEIVQPTIITKAIAKNPADLNNWMNALSGVGSERLRHQVVRISYSNSTSAGATAEFGPLGHDDIRNRVTSVSINEDYVLQSSGWSYPTADYQSHYAYDIHGNVTSYLSENTDLIADGRQFLRTDYEYDLLNGLPKKIHFQQGKIDQFSHHYKYDPDNRLKEVWTSKDGIIWDRDANYEYRLDGFLARTELGDLNVQGSDYAYTLHGWLKGMNSSVLNPAKDMGKDGAKSGADYISSSPDLHKTTGQDALAFTIGYYDYDYTAIDNNPLKAFMATTTGTAFATDINQLFNGNITSITNAMMDLDENPLDVTGTSYTYDQLHRFKESHVFTSGDITSLNSFVNATRQNITAGVNHSLGDWEAHAEYDRNGNIIDLDRRAYAQSPTTNKMDEFTYSYPTTNNKLDFVQDNIVGASYGDIADGQATGNYQYHADGTLKSDLQEEIGYIDWYPNGRVKEIYRLSNSTQSDLYFEYNTGGERILKVEKTKASAGVLNPSTAWNYTYYGSDANGTTLAVYQKTETENNLHRKEAMIYGSKRLGMFTREILTSTLTTDYHNRQVGEKFYELSDHLGNVKEVITDRKIVEADVSLPGEFVFLPDVISFSDYYPFGMEMAGRNGSLADYRYAFNGMEQDKEVSGDGNSYTTMFRQYDPRLGRWKSLDPLAAKFPSMSPFVGMDNNPVAKTDTEGLAAKTFNGPGNLWEKIRSYFNRLTIESWGLPVTYTVKKKYTRTDVIQISRTKNNTGFVGTYNSGSGGATVDFNAFGEPDNLNVTVGGASIGGTGGDRPGVLPTITIPPNTTFTVTINVGARAVGNPNIDSRYDVDIESMTYNETVIKKYKLFGIFIFARSKETGKVMLNTPPNNTKNRGKPRVMNQRVRAQRRKDLRFMRKRNKGKKIDSAEDGGVIDRDTKQKNPLRFKGNGKRKRKLRKR